MIKIYRSIYNTGVEPKIFLNDFMEILYYIKNISSLKIESSNFSLNDNEFNRIEKISKEIKPEILLLFWQFTIKALEELNIVSNQELSLEMFLIRLLYLKKINNEKKYTELKEGSVNQKNNELITNQTQDIENIIKSQSLDGPNFKNKTISQIKNFSQKEYIEVRKEINKEGNLIHINSFNELIEVCNDKKEIKLKYELENNVKLVSFQSTKIEISFNENLDRNFVKELSSKLFDWTKKRWVISFSKKTGRPTKKEEKELSEKKVFDEFKMTQEYKRIKKDFPDIEIIKVKKNDEIK